EEGALLRAGPPQRDAERNHRDQPGADDQHRDPARDSAHLAGVEREQYVEESALRLRGKGIEIGDDAAVGRADKHARLAVRALQFARLLERDRPERLFWRGESD